MLVEPNPLDYQKGFDVVVRRSVRNLSAEELDRLRQGYLRMMVMDDIHGYRYLAGIHGIPDFKGKHGHSKVFLPWNRAYIYWFEKYLQDALFDFSISLPWWDWMHESSQSDGIPKAFSDDTVNRRPNPLYRFRVVLNNEINYKSFRDLTGCKKTKKYYTHRQPGSPTTLPTAHEIEAILNITDYDEFSDQLEDCSNRVHTWVGGKCGDMSYLPFADL